MEQADSFVTIEEKEQPVSFVTIEEIEEQALRRFLDASSKQKKTVSQKAGEMMMAKRESIGPLDQITLRRLIGKNDLLPISYLHTGLRMSESVCRIVRRDRAGNEIGYGTGFLVSPEVVMTNNHVLRDIDSAANAVAEFNYQTDESSKECPVYRFSLNPERFFITDTELDFTLVSLHPISHTGEELKEIPHIELLSQEETISEKGSVSIIQHPEGGFKHVTVRDNQVIFLLDDFIHYTTDTQPGSSGSPVFNDQWVVVAIHHTGVRDPNSKHRWIANEGIRISSIADHVKEEYPKADEKTQEILEDIFMELKEERERKEDKSDKQEYTEDKSDKKENAEGEEQSQVKADQYRDGYDPLFLGEDYRIDLPKLSEEMERNSTKMEDGNNVLDYVHYSVVMCQPRGLAYFTAVNIDGGKAYKEIIPRNDKWFFDNRIESIHQYGNEVYVNNDLDRGHLVRRLDPVWGEKEVALQANDDTFYFTNCAPQHKNLNQKTWLKLEDYVLGNAQTHNLQISVFTGPVFNVKDKIYREKYQIPDEFWKVIVMVKKDGGLSATAYIQSQQDYTKALEEFVYGPYETYQVPIVSIEEKTGLDFGDLYLSDPYKDGESSGVLITELKNIRL